MLYSFQMNLKARKAANVRFRFRIRLMCTTPNNHTLLLPRPIRVKKPQRVMTSYISKVGILLDKGLKSLNLSLFIQESNIATW